MNKLSLAFAGTLALASTATAETVTATLSYRDGDGGINMIANARVEVWAINGICCWHQIAGPVEGAFRTDANGVLRAPGLNEGIGAEYALRVFATNPAAQVFQQDLYTVPFYREPGLPGPEIKRRVVTSSDTLDFSFTFEDAWARNHFNIADTIQKGKQYADARRDPRETDVINRVAVLAHTVGSSWYDPISHLIRFNTAGALDDLAVLHEYAHFLEESISSFYGVAATHDGCVATVGAVHVEEQGYAWMEGFADYFAQAVRRAMPTLLDGGLTGTTPLGVLETPSCFLLNPRHEIENFVAAALWDIVDTANEGLDELCGQTSRIDYERIVFQIFDRELDIGWTNPNLGLFQAAWIARELDLPPLQSTWAQSGIALPGPAALVHYDTLPAANLAVYRAGGASTWHVLGGSNGVAWGTWGDVPVPADYDGDGQTDLAVYRPSTGEWWVIKSASRRTSVAQWGAIGDVPLPGDYDGDGEVDFAVYRPSSQTLFINSDGCGGDTTRFVGPGIPVVGDVNGDGRDEPGVYDGGTGYFRFVRETGAVVTIRVGTGGGGTPKVGDFDGDGRSDPAVYRPSTGNWDIWRSSTAGVTTQWWGDAGDVPLVADFDGDNRSDLATFTPATGLWWIVEQDGAQWSYAWGVASDIPVPAP